MNKLFILVVLFLISLPSLSYGLSLKLESHWKTVVCEMRGAEEGDTSDKLQSLMTRKALNKDYGGVSEAAMALEKYCIKNAATIDKDICTDASSISKKTTLLVKLAQEQKQWMNQNSQYMEEMKKYKNDMAKLYERENAFETKGTEKQIKVLNKKIIDLVRACAQKNALPSVDSPSSTEETRGEGRAH